MKKLIKIALVAFLLAGSSVTYSFADAVKGQKLYSKKLKKSCGMTGAKFAAKHSQDEWEEINNSGNFEKEIIKICPNIKEGEIKKSWQKHIYDFSYEYANDSGNVPSC